MIDQRLLALLACTGCGGSFVSADRGRAIECTGCRGRHPVRDGIPRFVRDDDSYASSFGLQWNEFRTEQIDSLSGLDLSRDRLLSETNWDWKALEGRLILDAGCGAGRFLDIASQYGCTVVGVDLTIAVDAARCTLQDRPNVMLVQASLFDLPFQPGVFDGCYCIGVLQHTPSRERAAEAFGKVLKAGGELALTVYERKRWTKLNGKYLVRPLTKRLPTKKLLRLVERAMPVLFPLTSALFRLPILGRAFAFVIPVANYVHEPRLTQDQRYRWAVLDTFDMLAPGEDSPLTVGEVAAALRSAGFLRITRLPIAGLTVNAVKGPDPDTALRRNLD